MEFENLDAILDFAIEKEIEAAEFYESVSEEETFSGKKKMLQEFAEQERKHQRLLEELKEKGIVESVEDYEFKWIADLNRSDYVVELEYRKGMDYNELLTLAMKREEKALRLYNELLKKAETENAKKVFKLLCQEEAKHKLALESTLDDYMADMGD